MFVLGDVPICDWQWDCRSGGQSVGSDVVSEQQDPLLEHFACGLAWRIDCRRIGFVLHESGWRHTDFVGGADFAFLGAGGSLWTDAIGTEVPEV